MLARDNRLLGIYRIEGSTMSFLKDFKFGLPMTLVWALIIWAWLSFLTTVFV